MSRSPDILPVYAGLLIGGGSSRMGRPKQFIRYRGASFVERVRAAVAPHVSRTVLLGEGAVPQSCAQLPRLADVPETAGPIAGMLAALRSAPDTAWLIVACDLPRVHADAVRWLLDQRAPDRWAILPKVAGGRVEPLLALYEPPARGLLEDLLDRGLPAPRHLSGYRQVYSPVPPKQLADAWRNVNTPAELDELRQ